MEALRKAIEQNLAAAPTATPAEQATAILDLIQSQLGLAQVVSWGDGKKEPKFGTNICTLVDDIHWYPIMGVPVELLSGMKRRGFYIGHNMVRLLPLPKVKGPGDKP